MVIQHREREKSASICELFYLLYSYKQHHQKNVFPLHTSFISLVKHIFEFFQYEHTTYLKLFIIGPSDDPLTAAVPVISSRGQQLTSMLSLWRHCVAGCHERLTCRL